MTDADAREYHLVIASRFENIELVHVVIEDALRQAAASDDQRHWIGLALREALANAIKHGNRQDPAKRVDVEARVSPRQIRIRIRDEGAGFVPDAVRDPLSEENRFRADGRGIFYMRRLMDEVEFRFGPEGGTMVTLVKRLDTVQDTDTNQKEEQR
ncbi:MAG: ATP-binding protein [Acidobacteria bacterium]|jgi:serine/threonine-protein kinase RsbW|nr:ATP-binding protein [Thermoanaerobaculia bacterium]MDI9630348.1 ATP-binding protein [Acidobacteriota bacterium]OQC40457.1 MAG: Anti-sigma F factor [Acidobacteria bacterium ADurb.Bin051]MBP7813089.1 ATP-binding protein [Thermoanaerobaculia bacterium]MBP8845722.1 ATP-binding protein [Thermoanaerobaculia bacterium]